ncbi:SusC/RagA family TonB-linked outer membrane protein [Flavivirga eckloniae]|uniref:Secretin/TonB short N-terminal domain-containing protein n=1 Tax=Flavivirga eckloniae TaxID=1803846 RepID=A0A2K9PLK4_9FLAO|nr:SusC/RagA family TonB-linked outer membrane protein [Flavivirga eckloniae]AUP77932.1 hypothetical protein C1H87_04075 [Flavivirga eckloniae]
MKKLLNEFRVLNNLYKPDLKMKLTYILFFSTFLQIQANGYSQGTKVSLSFENESIEKVFEEVEASTNFKFLYNSNSININRKVTINVENKSLKLVLKRLFKGTNVKFTIVDRQVILRLFNKSKPQINKPVQSIKTSTSTITDQQTITGRVLDSYGDPIPGVNIIIKGTQQGAFTDFDGSYKIRAAVGDTLYFTGIGFIDQEIVVGMDTVYDVVMKYSTIVLDDVDILYTGYEKIPEERATGSFENVREKTLKRKTDQNILSKINGEVSGVLFNGDGTGRDIDRIIIRGLSSINANTSPLVVVNGFPIEGSINNINPNDIKSITILKDAAAASIWGIRATNGVIVVVTKNGKKSKSLSVDANVTTSFTPTINLTDNNLASADAQVDFYEGLFNAGIFDSDVLFSGALNQTSFEVVHPVIEALLLAQEGLITSQEAENRLDRLRRIDGRDEYTRLFVRPKIWNQYTIALSGGGENNDYRASLTYNGNKEDLLNDKSDQIIANITNNFDFNSKLHLRTNINTSFTKQRFSTSNPDLQSIQSSDVDPLGYLFQIPLNTQILDTNGNYLPTVGIGSNAQTSQLALDSGFLHPWEYNIKQEFDNHNSTARQTELRFQTALSYDISDALKAEVSYQYETSSGNANNIYNQERFVTRNLINLYTQRDADGTITSTPVPDGSIADFVETNLNSHTFRTQLNYDNDFKNGQHKVNGIIGYEARKVTVERRERRLFGYNSETLTNANPDFTTTYELAVFQDAEQIPNPSRDRFVENRFLSYYANLGYTYDDRYTITGSTRLDDTNLFGASKEFRNIPLYSLGVKWNIANENFFNLAAISDLQFRATYGTNGNVDTSTSPFLQAGFFQGNEVFTTNSAFVSTVPNPQLRLEKTRTTNLGLDITLWNGIVEANIDYYNKDSEDLLSFRALNATSGIRGSLLNVGNLTNRGIDTGLSLRLVSSENLNYTTKANFSYNRNEVTNAEVEDFDVSTFITGTGAIEGNALGTIYSFNYAGLDQNGRPQFIDETGEIVDFTTDITSTDALVKMGTEVPVYYGSWINDLSYKNWSLRTLTTFTAGHVFRNSDVFDPAASFGNTFRDFNNRWQQRGDENTTDVPAQISSFTDLFASGYQNYLSSDKFVDDASTIRLQEIILSYAFDAKTLKALKVDQLQLSLQANNVKVWNFNKWNIDPNNSLIQIQPRFTFSISTTF